MFLRITYRLIRDWFHSPKWLSSTKWSIPFLCFVILISISAKNSLAGGQNINLANQLSVSTTSGPIDANFTADITRGCSPLMVNFTNTSTGGILFHSWSFGDGFLSTEWNPQHTFTNTTGRDTVYTVTLFVTDFFTSDQHRLFITVHPDIEAGFGITPAAGCHPLTVEIRDASIGAITYQWDFGDGTTSTTNAPLFTRTYNNTGLIADTLTIRQIVSNLQGCRDTITRPVIVFPRLEASFIASGTVGCAGYTVDFRNTSTLTAQQFFWDFGDGGTSSLPNPQHTFQNNTNATIAYNVTLTVVSANFCQDTYTIPITVHPFLDAAFDFQPSEVCNPHRITFTNKSSGGTSFEWNFGDGTTITRTDTLPVSHIYSHTNTIPVTYNILLTVRNPQGCLDTVSKRLTVFPRIVSNFSATPTAGCNNLEVRFTNNSIGAVNYFWDFGDGATSTVPNPTHRFENLSHANDAIFDVWLYAESMYGCRDSIRRQITVYPAIIADFAIQSVQGCTPFTATIVNHSRGATSYSWNFGDGTTSSSGLNTLFHTFVNSGSTTQTFTIELAVTNALGCRDTIRQVINVFPAVTADFTSSIQMGCNPLPVSFVNNSRNADSYLWNFGDGVISSLENPAHTFYNPSHFADSSFVVNLTAQSIYGCLDTATTMITVNPKPNALFSIANSPGCSPHEIIITNSSQGADQYFWNFGDGSPESNAGGTTITHIFNHNHGTGPRNFDIQLIITNRFGCSDTLVQQARIFPNIIADFTVDIASGCHPLTVSFTNNSTGADAQTPFWWVYGDGNTSNNSSAIHTHTFHNLSHTRDTVYRVMLVAQNINGCTDTIFRDITVFAAPHAFFAFPHDQACAPYEINIQNLSIGGNHFEWDMADGTLYSHAVNFSHTYTLPAGSPSELRVINLEVTNSRGCVRTYSRQLLLFPEVTADFNANNVGCHPHPVIFENLSVGADLFYWNFGNGNFSQNENPEHIFLNYSHTATQTYTVTLRSESRYGCFALDTIDIYVRPLPRADFDFSASSGCSPFTPQITNLSLGATTFDWNFGNGVSNASNPSNTWNNTRNTPVNYTTQLRVSNQYGCEASTSKIIRVYPEVTADFGVEGDTWGGCSPLELRFRNQSSLASTFRWNFDDGTTSLSARPLKVFTNQNTNDRIFNVHLTATSLHGCTDTITRQVTVYPTPHANFTATPITQPYPNTTITLTNLTNPGNWNFHWEYGDGNFTHTTSTHPFTHTYDWTGQDMHSKTYTIALRATNGQCSGIFMQRVTITSPVPDARFDAVWSGCVPFTVQFNNRSTHSNRYWWDFGNGSVSNEPNPTHIFHDPGIYNVRLIAVGDGGSDTVYHRIAAIANPVADFELASILVKIPDEPLRLINNSQLGDFYLWDFGDGNTSSLFEPVYYYQQPGIYNISLTVIRNTHPQCSDTMVLKNALRVAETCKLLFPNAFMPGAAGQTGGHYDPNIPTISVFHPVHIGVNEDEYVLEIYTRWGELIFRSEDINIGWDGYVKGRPAPMGVYVWKVNSRCNDGTQIYKAGDVTLYR